MLRIIICFALLQAAGGFAYAQSADIKTFAPAAPDGFYSARDYSSLLKGGFSSFTSLSEHFALYQGYVKNANILIGRLKTLEEEGKTSEPGYAELKRRFGWEFNGMRLHELYFSGLGAAPMAEASPLKEALAAQFGSFEQWRASFLGLAQVRGAGWAALAHDRQTGYLHNVWITDHDGGVPAGADILLVMDLFEHAYLLDFKLDKAPYAQAFFDAVNWPAVEKRFEKIR